MHEILDWLLRIVGTMAIIKVVWNVLFNNNKWSNNIKIVRIDDGETKEYDYNLVYNFGDYLNTVTIIEGNIFPIREINVYECEFSKNKFLKRKLLYSRKNLLPGQALFLNLDYGCVMPRYMVEIINYNFEKAKILLSENGFNGNINHENGIKYKSTLLSKIYNSIYN